MDEKQRKLNTTPVSKSSEPSERLLRRKRHRSKLPKEEIQYQHFIHDLEKNMLIKFSLVL